MQLPKWIAPCRVQLRRCRFAMRKGVDTVSYLFNDSSHGFSSLISNQISTNTSQSTSLGRPCPNDDDLWSFLSEMCVFYLFAAKRELWSLYWPSKHLEECSPYSLRAVKITLTCGGRQILPSLRSRELLGGFRRKNVIRRAVTWTFWICQNHWISTKGGGGLGDKNREKSGMFKMITVSMFSNRFWWEKVFWASKIQVFKISDEGFRKPKSQRRTQVKKKWWFLKKKSKNSWDFSPIFHFHELYDDITWFSTENAFSIA